jgi:hypothetical protein
VCKILLDTLFDGPMEVSTSGETDVLHRLPYAS